MRLALAAAAVLAAAPMLAGPAAASSCNRPLFVALLTDARVARDMHDPFYLTTAVGPERAQIIAAGRQAGQPVEDDAATFVHDAMKGTQPGLAAAIVDLRAILAVCR